MRHRHLMTPSDAPVAALPAAAVQDLLERGDLDDWRPLLRAIASDPWGDVAALVGRLADAYPLYGTSTLWRAWIDRQRARWEGPLPGVAPATLRAVREHMGRTQADVSRRLQISQSDVSKLERRGDLRLSSLRAYARAVGASLRVLLGAGGRVFELGSPPSPRRRRGSGRQPVPPTPGPHASP